MKLIDAFDLASTTRPKWRTRRGAWNHPWKCNRTHCLRILGETKNVKKITKGDLVAMRSKLAMEKKSPATINRIMSLLNSVFVEMVEHEVIEKYPRIKNLKENNARKLYYSKEQIDAMVFACKDIFHYFELADAILFSLYTGCRRANMLQLEVRDVDLVNDTINFRDPKGGEDYMVDIHPDLRVILADRCDGEEPNYRVFQFRDHNEVWYQFVKIRDYCALPKGLVYHSIRHTTGTWLAERGVPIQNIARVLGHKTLEMSMRYTKLSDKARKSAIDSL